MRTRIRVVRLDKHARETKLGALATILEAKEVQTAMKRLRLETPFMRLLTSQ